MENKIPWQTRIGKRNLPLLIGLYVISFVYSIFHYVVILKIFHNTFVGSLLSILQSIIAGIAPVLGILQLVNSLMEFDKLDYKGRRFFFIAAAATLLYIFGLIMLVPIFFRP